MKRLKITVLVSFVCIFCSVSAQQTSTSLTFQVRYGAQELVLNTYYRVNSSDSLRITAFRFYISNLELLHKGKTVWKETDSAHLLDVEQPSSLTIAGIPGLLAYDQIRFGLGIDSTTNVSGAMGGDLDPMFGMYWSWQSGYVNLKLEGNSNVCATRDQAFEFHLGGYRFPDGALQIVSLPVKSGKNITMVADLGLWMENIDLAHQHHLLSPGPEAVRLMKAAAAMFKVQY